MANLNIGASLATVTTLASLPVDKGTIYATLSAPTNLSLAAAMYQGQSIEVVINPTSFITQPMPTTTGWYTTFGETLTLLKDVMSVLTIICIGSNQYLISSKNVGGEKTNGYECVDLGLPSGLLWATCNVGANNPWETGKYFQWGATEGYHKNTSEVLTHSYWSTCPFNNGSSSFDSSYFNSVSGTVCPNEILALQYDTARANMDGEWRMPTIDETRELINNTTSGWTVMSGVSGVTLTSNSNSNSLFIPVSGNYYNGSFEEGNRSGYLWTSTKNHTSYGSHAIAWDFKSTYIDFGYGDTRNTGMQVRGVIG